MDLRRMIAEWVRDNDCSGFWLRELLHHLTQSGASMEDAVRAMEQFVDAAILAKHEKYRLMPDAPPPGGARFS
jgi:hypothetical protein